jgi:sugar phosphate isomerase/epimerase
MKISCCWLFAISKYGYPPSLPDTHRALEEMEALGFKNVELEGVGEENLRAVYDARQELKKRCEDLGLTVVNFCPVLPDLVHPDKARRIHALDLFKLGVETAGSLGCEMVQTVSATPPLTFVGEAPYKEALAYGQRYQVKVDPAFRWDDLWGWLTDSMGACADEADRAGLTLCVEPRVGEIISNTDALLRLMEAVDSDNFGAVLDTGHLHAQKEILPLSVEKLGSRIRYVHASDNDGQTNQHLPPGKGTIDWEGVFLALKKHDFAGYVAVDVGNVPTVDAAYTESKSFLENLARRLDV